MSSNEQTILIVDDEPDIRELLEITLGRMGLNTLSAEDVGSAQAALTDAQIDLCLTDMKLPDGSGMDIIGYIQKTCPQVPVAVITAFGSMDLAIDSMKAGAFDFVSKPIDLERLRKLVNNALKLSPEATPQLGDSNVQLLGESEQIEKLKGQIVKLARSQAPVYISGESGSGKEVVARLIHASGPRKEAPFIPVNCGAIPNELVESELFGYIKGSFTGATGDKAGLFEAAQGGTLFLDEIADLPLSMQVKLLRAIQEKSIRRVGSSQEIPVDVRVLSATHKDLAKEVEQGNFRTDLFYRLNVIQVKVPALRERKEDIPLLTDFLLQRIAADWGIAKPTLSEDAINGLTRYPFPGNVRELENIIERAITLCEGDTINLADLQLPTDVQPVPSTTSAGDPSQAFGDLEGYLEDIEKAALQAALEKTSWNRTEAAKLLGLSFRQMRYKLKKLGMEHED